MIFFSYKIITRIVNQRLVTHYIILQYCNYCKETTGYPCT